MADWADAFDGQTVLQHARKPYMDKLAKEGRTGMVCTVPEGFTPGSEVANMGVLGYDVHKVFEGRGVLEAANIGVDLKDGDMGMRCNLICVENGCIKNHSAGHLSTDEGRELIGYLERELGSDTVSFHPGDFVKVRITDGSSATLQGEPLPAAATCGAAPPLPGVGGE